MIATFYSQPVVFSTSEAEVIGLILAFVGSFSFVAGLVTYYKHSRCHNTECRYEWRKRRLPFRRHGKYPHKHYKACHVHHPDVPSDGKVTQEHIQAIHAEPSYRKKLP